MERRRQNTPNSEARQDLVWAFDFSELGNYLLNRVKEIANRIEERCHFAMQSTRDTRDAGSSDAKSE